MRNSFKFLLVILVVISVFGCGLFKKKYNEDMQKIIEESRKIQKEQDSLYRKELNDSIMKNLNKDLQKLDSQKIKVDSIQKELEKQFKKSR